MNSLFDYLAWRGDLTMYQDPFNEVDNLLLAELAYTDFEGVFEEDREYSISEAAEKYFTLHTEEEVRARVTLIGHAPLLLKPMAQSARFRDLTLSGYVNVVDVDREEQFSALVYRICVDNREVLSYVAYRGTDNNLIGWKEDFNLSFLDETPSQKRAVEYLEKHMSAAQAPFYVGGHSKGGNLAIYAAARADRSLQDKILAVYSNDGPGFREELVESEGYRRILPRIISIVPEFSVVGMLLHNSLEHQVIRSSRKGVRQHDALSWEVLGNRFVRVSGRTETSVLLDNTIRSWLLDMDDTERQQFVDLLYSLFDAPGEHTVEGLKKQGIRSLGDISKALLTLPAEKRKSFNQSLWKLVQSGGETFFDDLRGDLMQKVAAAQEWMTGEDLEKEQSGQESPGAEQPEQETVQQETQEEPEAADV